MNKRWTEWVFWRFSSNFSEPSWFGCIWRKLLEIWVKSGITPKQRMMNGPQRKQKSGCCCCCGLGAELCSGSASWASESSEEYLSLSLTACSGDIRREVGTHMLRSGRRSHSAALLKLFLKPRWDVLWKEVTAQQNISSGSGPNGILVTCWAGSVLESFYAQFGVFFVKRRNFRNHTHRRKFAPGKQNRTDPSSSTTARDPTSLPRRRISNQPRLEVPACRICPEPGWRLSAPGSAGFGLCFSPCLCAQPRWKDAHTSAAAPVRMWTARVWVWRRYPKESLGARSACE